MSACDHVTLDHMTLDHVTCCVSWQEDEAETRVTAAHLPLGRGLLGSNRAQ